MSSILIATDGASRNNGKPHCCAAGGAWVVEVSESTIVSSKCLADYELENSSNQRGEMLGLLSALTHCSEYTNRTIIMILDSEFVFNTMSKEWLQKWHSNGYFKADGNSVANEDLWRRIYKAYNSCENNGLEFVWVHIKGHLMPVGKVTAQTCLDTDSSGKQLYRLILDKYTLEAEKRNIKEKALECFIKNNHFEPDELLLRRCVTMNLVADAIATRAADAANALSN